MRFWLTETDTHAAGLSSLFLCLTGINHSCPKGSACRVQAPGNNRDPRRQAHGFPGFPGDFSHDLITWKQLRKLLQRDPQLPAQLFIPLPVLHMKHVQAVPLGKILCEDSGKAIHNITVALQKLKGILKDLRPLFPEP